MSGTGGEVVSVGDDAGESFEFVFGTATLTEADATFGPDIFFTDGVAVGIDYSGQTTAPIRGFPVFINLQGPDSLSASTLSGPSVRGELASIRIASQAVPEPSSMALAGASAAGLAILRRLRRRA